MNQLSELERNDRVMVIVDSVGNLASKKKLTMRLMVSLLRYDSCKTDEVSVSNDHTTFDIERHSCVVVNPPTKIGLFPKDIVSGGTGIYYSAITFSSLADNKKNKEKMLSDTTSSLTLRSLLCP